ncbi:MAG: hypothetical protein Q9201_003645 [Fulgogasparrea decipioides]
MVRTAKAMPGPPDGQDIPHLARSQASASPRSLHIPTHAERAKSNNRCESEEQNGHIRPMTETPKSTHPIEEDPEPRRRGARRSGGFLLHDVAPTYTYLTLQPPRQRQINDIKGKGKAEDGDTVPPKSTTGVRRRRKPSIGSSPLSTEAYNQNDTSGSQNLVSHGSDQILPIHPEPDANTRLSSNTSSVTGRLSGNEPHIAVESSPSTFGHGTDSAQIVNLALNLSESRRRNVSAGRLYPVYVNGARRHVSSEQNPPGLTGRPISIGGINLRRHLNDQRRISRNLAASSSISNHDSPSPRSAQCNNGDDIYASSRFYSSDITHETVLHPSEATLARAEKARITFELSYEYRRLLQYLPKLPAPSSSRAVTSKADNGPESVASYDLGRVYDPLQYIRNRKVRGRERKHLDAEAEGFKDTNRVKLWVDMVVSKRGAEDSPRNDKTVLPTLDSVQVDLYNGQTPPTPGDSPRSNARPTKSEKQNLNWAFTPWDLLADAVWLDSDENIKLIEDAKGNKLLPSKRTSKANTPRTSLEQARPPSKRSLSLPRQPVPDQHGPRVIDTKPKHSRLRGHIRGKPYEVKASSHGYESPQDRRGRWRRNFIRSRSPSSSEESLTNGASGYAWGRHRDQDGLDTAAPEKHMMELLAQEIDDDPFSSPQVIQPTKDRQNKEKVPSERKRSVDDTAATESEHQASKSEQDLQLASSTQSQTLSRHSPQEQRGRQPRVSFDGLDVVASDSPSGFHFGPSIFINRSASNSRSVSPKKALPSRLRPSLHRRTDSRRSVSENDFAVDRPSHDRSGPQRGRHIGPKDSHQGVQKSDSASNLLSPVTAELLGKRFRRFNNSSSSIKGVKENKDPEFRFRGLLKRSRIAELVGNEVSKVGDMILRRDGSNISRPTTPVSAKAPWDSETDGEHSTLENTPETDLSRATTNNDDGGRLSRISTKNNQPTYHFQNLPAFRSSISQASPGSSTAASPEDHPIIRQQMAQKARGRSRNFERLAPPRIDMRNVSPSASPSSDRTRANATRNSSTSHSDHRVRDADRRFNDVLGIPGTVRNAVAPTGLSNFSSSTTKHHTSTDRLALGDRQWSISDRSVSNTHKHGTATKRDIARVRALLLSSGIKANEITRQANSIDDPPFLPQLREIRQKLGAENIPRVPRAQEHLLTARLIVKEIESVNQSLRDAAECFSTSTVEDLHSRFKKLDEEVTGNVIPHVRNSADDADHLSTELTTTWTLEVRNLSERVERGLRRRRRRLRWVRRGGWVLLEWVLLGIMWCVWGIVVVVRVVKGVIGGVLGVVRWMLWL